VCQPNPPGDSWQDSPVVILEVVSASTRHLDLGEKLDSYLTISTLAAHLVVESAEAVVQVSRRSPNGEFRRELALGLEAIVELPELDARLALANLYEGVAFETEAEVE